MDIKCGKCYILVGVGLKNSEQIPRTRKEKIALLTPDRLED